MISNSCEKLTKNLRTTINKFNRIHVHETRGISNKLTVASDLHIRPMCTLNNSLQIGRPICNKDYNERLTSRINLKTTLMNLK